MNGKNFNIWQILSPNACDISGSVGLGVDFFEHLSIKQSFVFQAFVKYVLMWVK